MKASLRQFRAATASEAPNQAHCTGGLTQSGAGQRRHQLRRVVCGLPGSVGLVRLQPRQEFEQNLLRDFAASPLQVREGREAEAALQAVVLGSERRVSRGEARVGARSLWRERRGRRARHVSRSTAQWHRGARVRAKGGSCAVRNGAASGRTLHNKRRRSLLEVLASSELRKHEEKTFSKKKETRTNLTSSRIWTDATEVSYFVK